MGGCPYCGNGRSAGHVATEDFVYLCEELGINTGLDLDKLIEATAVAEDVVGRVLAFVDSSSAEFEVVEQHVEVLSGSDSA